MPRFACDAFSCDLNEDGHILAAQLEGKTFEFPLGYSLYEVQDRFADTSLDRALLSLSTGGKTRTLRLTTGDQLHISAENGGWRQDETAAVSLPFPAAAEFHIPEGHNLGRKIDADMPGGEQYATRPGYNFILVKCGDLWLRFQITEHSAYQRHAPGGFTLARHPDVFLAAWSWKPAQSDAHLAVFPTMEAAVDDFRRYLEQDLGVRPLADRRELPDWVRQVPLVFIIDMMRSHGVISHDYGDVTRMARDLQKAGCPQETLFYLPGWAGPYDAVYPTYAPHDELGGDEPFREMMDTMHACGFRVMVHTNPWGLDPCHPDIDRCLQYVVKDRDGKYAGFQTASHTKWGQMAPKFRLLKFRTGRVPLPGGSPQDGVFETVPVPDRSEALLTLGGFQGEGRLAVTVGRRTLKTPSGAFAKGGEHTIAFPFLLEPGPNRVRLSLEGKLELEDGWYRIHDCRVPPDRYATWTYPILFADTLNAEWQRIYVDNVAQAVEAYGIDAIHCDATEYQWNKPIYDALQERLPSLPVSGEGYATLSALGYYAFAQSARCQTLIGYLDAMRGTEHQGSIPDSTKIEQELAWLDKESPVSSFVDDYIRVYPHLCAANAFVPVGKVCNLSEPGLTPRDPAALWKVLRDAKRLRCVPALRLNYREHGLDAESRKAVRELSR